MCFVSSKQNNIYTPVPGLSSPVEICSCSESMHCCVQCVIPFSWCWSVFDRRVMAEWLGHWTQQWAEEGVFEILRPVFETGLWLMKQFAHQTSNIRCTLEGNKIVDDSDLVGTSPVGAAPVTSSFSTWYLTSMDWAKATARRHENHLSFVFLCLRL